MLYRFGVGLCLVVGLLSLTRADTDRYSMFSGTVSEIGDNRVTVHRQPGGTLAGEKRTFVITETTKVEGDLRLSARVTVSFISREQGHVAARIIVRRPNPRRN